VQALGRLPHTQLKCLLGAVAAVAEGILALILLAVAVVRLLELMQLPPVLL
jgi:hypothetical protein